MKKARMNPGGKEEKRFSQKGDKARRLDERICRETEDSREDQYRNEKRRRSPSPAVYHRSRRKSSHSESVSSSDSSSYTSSSDDTSVLYDGFLSDSDESGECAVEWMRVHGRKAHIEGRRRYPEIHGDTLLEVVRCVKRAGIKGKYGNWDDYLQFLHRHSRKCRPPPGRAPEQQTNFLLRNFLKSLHDSDRVGDVRRVIDQSSRHHHR